MRSCLVWILGFWPLGLLGQAFPVRFTQQSDRVEVKVGKQVITQYYYPGPDVLKKPVLFPVSTPSGIVVTRGWPLNPLPGDAQDHPHHVGVWFNYESVNGHDYWNNSIEAEKARDPRAFGTILSTKVGPWKNGKKGRLPVEAVWQDAQGNQVLDEKTEWVFQGTSRYTLIDRTTTLTARDQPVVFRDIKDGLFAIRVRRELEHPARVATTYTDATGQVTTVAASAGSPTGQYRNQAGQLGENTWGQRSPWVTLTGFVDGKSVSISLLDHPDNPGYPAYWHTRGYGLFAVNPLGQAIFSGGKETLNLTLAPQESVTFRYRLVVADQHFNPEELNAWMNR